MTRIWTVLVWLRSMVLPAWDRVGSVQPAWLARAPDAQDGLFRVDAIGIERAHIVGRSMGA